MATKKTPLDLDSDFSMDAPAGNDADLEQAIDDLRGVLKNDADGELPDVFATGASGDFGGDFGASAPDMDFGGSATSGFGASAPAAPGDFTPMQGPGSALNANLDLIMDIPIEVQIILGTSKMQVSGLMNLSEGATIALDKKIGEPVDIIVNGRKIARGEITVLEGDDTRFGVKLIEVMRTKKA